MPKYNKSVHIEIFSLSYMSNQPLKKIGSTIAEIRFFVSKRCMVDRWYVFWFWFYCCRRGSIMCDTVIDVT